MRNEKKIDENQKQTEKSTYIKTLSTNIGTVCVCDFVRFFGKIIKTIRDFADCLLIRKISVQCCCFFSSHQVQLIGFL